MNTDSLHHYSKCGNEALMKNNTHRALEEVNWAPYWSINDLLHNTICFKASAFPVQTEETVVHRSEMQHQTTLSCLYFTQLTLISEPNNNLEQNKESKTISVSSFKRCWRVPNSNKETWIKKSLGMFIYVHWWFVRNGCKN